MSLNFNSTNTGPNTAVNFAHPPFAQGGIPDILNLSLPSWSFSDDKSTPLGLSQSHPAVSQVPPQFSPEAHLHAKNRWEGLSLLRQPWSTHNDPNVMALCHGSSYGMDIASGARRKNATRETTSLLKAWLNEHRRNPYPTKGEKIMLAIITRMSMTQVSTWFANARRRLKKENKMTWSPRNRIDNTQNGDDFDDSCCGDDEDIDALEDVDGFDEDLSLVGDAATISHAFGDGVDSSASNPRSQNRLPPASKPKIWSIVDTLAKDNDANTVATQPTNSVQSSAVFQPQLGLLGDPALHGFPPTPSSGGAGVLSISHLEALRGSRPATTMPLDFLAASSPMNLAAAAAYIRSISLLQQSVLQSQQQSHNRPSPADVNAQLTANHFAHSLVASSNSDIMPKLSPAKS